MKIACLSGKGGVGKTFIAVNLASVAGKCTYIDCDVEEPNGHIFFKPTNTSITNVIKLLPKFDSQKCSGCRKCVEFCKFNGLVFIKDKPMLLADVCHSCGGCMLVCPSNAVTETEKIIGMITKGYSKDITVISGVLNTGEASGVPIIQQAIKQAKGTTIIDCPPGSACTVMESIADADYCVLVTEPTAFAFHNFKMVYQLVSLLGKKCGVIINKSTEKYPPLLEFCTDKNIEILDQVAYDKKLAKALSNGQIATNTSAKLNTQFKNILAKIGSRL